MDQLVSIGGLGPRTPVLDGVGPTSERIGQRNRVATTGTRMDELFLPGPAVGGSCG